ncbi:MAG: hypothetical protein ABR508_06270 [Candidatus Baltobacteraceae bacterium]
MLSSYVLAAVVQTGNVKPIRSMLFAFHASGQTEGISHYGGIETGLPGVSTNYSLGGYDGTIAVDVLALGPEKSLVLRITQSVPLAHSLDVPAGECAVYPDGQVKFDPGAVKFSTPELTLTRFLGRTFVNADAMDDKNHWAVDLATGRVNVRSDFTVTSNNNGVVSIDEKRVLKDGNDESDTTGRISYDIKRMVPLSIHEESVEIYGSGSVRTGVDYTLKADSLAPR